jgi:hypothetical protein
MAPVHLVLWLQPELRPDLVEGRGLHIERRYKVPVPDFQYPRLAPACPSAVRAAACDPQAPRLESYTFQSDLTPLGLEPRAGTENRIPTENVR